MQTAERAGPGSDGPRPTAGGGPDLAPGAGRARGTLLARRRPGRSSGRWRALSPSSWLPALVALGALSLAWQLVAVHNPTVLPTDTAVLSELWHSPGLFWHDTLVTLQEVAVGLTSSFALAFGLAVAMSYLKVIERAVMPLAVVLNVTPVVALAPGLVVAFGFDLVPRYIVTAVIVFFPFLVNSLVGLRSADPEALEVLRTLHASQFETLVRLRLPSSLPYLFAAARVCLPLSVVGAVVAEMSSSGDAGGLGSLIETASAYSDLARIYAAILVLAALGLALTLAVVVLERRALSWRAPASGS